MKIAPSPGVAPATVDAQFAELRDRVTALERWRERSTAKDAEAHGTLPIARCSWPSQNRLVIDGSCPPN